MIRLPAAMGRRANTPRPWTPLLRTSKRGPVVGAETVAAEVVADVVEEGVRAIRYIGS
jgi:hypothetical protein